jgi:transmembrane sensor
MSSEDDLVGGMDAQAAVWVVKHDGHGLSTAEQAAFDRWIADPVHEAAYRAIVQSGPVPANWCSDARAASAPRPVSREQWPTLADHAAPTHRGRRCKPRGAGVTQVGAFSIWLRADYATGAGERLLANLSDGSVVTLDGRSAIAYDDSGRRRILRLLEGSAYFDIAPDQSRPLYGFDWRVGSVTALGTAFGIRERDDAAELAVTEHDVRVRTEAGRTAVAEGGRGREFRC